MKNEVSSGTNFSQYLTELISFNYYLNYCRNQKILKLRALPSHQLPIVRCHTVVGNSPEKVYRPLATRKR